MENWGLITYRTAVILFDPKASDAKFKQRIAYTVSHELAHQVGRLLLRCNVIINIIKVSYKSYLQLVVWKPCHHGMVSLIIDICRSAYIYLHSMFMSYYI